MKRKHTTPKMGITKNKMYKYPSTPAMGKAGGKGTTLSLFGAIGSAGQKLADQDRANVKFASDRMEKPGMRRTGKGSYEFINPKDKANKTAELLNTAQTSLFSRNTSVPAMGPIGAVVGASGGRKLGSWVGSAGKLLGKKHEKYGRLAGEYIGGSLGGVFGGLLSPI